MISAINNNQNHRKCSLLIPINWQKSKTIRLSAGISIITNIRKEWTITTWIIHHRCTISKTSARVSSGFQMQKKHFNHKAAGQVILLFLSIWKPDETRSTSFLSQFCKETIQNYAGFYFSHFSFKCLVCVICCIQSAIIVFESFCF